jgi:hypothetical protein
VGKILSRLPPRPLSFILKDYGFAGALEGAQFGVEVVNELSLALSPTSRANFAN